MVLPVLGEEGVPFLATIMTLEQTFFYRSSHGIRIDGDRFVLALVALRGYDIPFLMELVALCKEGLSFLMVLAALCEERVLFLVELVT
jgi:hypothetical protein